MKNNPFNSNFYRNLLEQCENIYELALANPFYQKAYAQFVNQSLKHLPSTKRAAPITKEIVFQEGDISLYHYKARTKKALSVPILIVFALINTPKILDMTTQISFIKFLLDEGLDVYLIDWGFPNEYNKKLTLSSYINYYLKRSVELIVNRSGQKKINLLGICQGGVLSLCYSALYTSHIKNLITLVTPVNFHSKNDLLSDLIRHVDIGLMVDKLGNIPGKLLSYFFLTFKPYRLLLKKYLPAFEKMNDKTFMQRFLLIENWIFNMPDQAGEAFKQFIIEFYQKNNLIAGKIMLARKRVNLNNINMPVLNVIASDDYIVPADASIILPQYIATKDYTKLVLSGGHIGIYVSQNTSKKLAKMISQWLLKRE